MNPRMMVAAYALLAWRILHLVPLLEPLMGIDEEGFSFSFAFRHPGPHAGEAKKNACSIAFDRDRACD